MTTATMPAAAPQHQSSRHRRPVVVELSAHTRLAVEQAAHMLLEDAQARVGALEAQAALQHLHQHGRLALALDPRRFVAILAIPRAGHSAERRVQKLSCIDDGE